MVLSKMTEDQAFRKAFGPEEARSFAMGIPLLSKNYDIPNMKVTEETRPLIDVVYDEMSNQAVAEADGLAEGQKEFTLGIIANEVIPDRMFLSEDENDRFYLKPTEAVRPLLRTVEMRPPYKGAKDYFYIADVDDRDYLSLLVRKTCEALPMLKPKRTRM